MKCIRTVEVEFYIRSLYGDYSPRHTLRFLNQKAESMFKSAGKVVIKTVAVCALRRSEWTHPSFDMSY